MEDRPETQEAAEKNAGGPDRITLLRDILVLQFKLIVDGVRDFVLVPVSLVVGVISLLKGGDKPGTEFYDLLRYGRHTDHVINLFGAARRVHDNDDGMEDLPDIDEMVGRVETYVVDEYRRGDMSAQTKARIEQLIAAINRGRRGRDEDSGDRAA